MLKKTPYWLFVFIFLILIYAVSAEVGVVAVGTKEIKFEPNLETEFIFTILADSPVSVSATGDFKEFVSFDKTEFKLGPKREYRDVVMTIKLPETPLDLFGKRELFFTITEGIPTSKGGAIARGAIKSRILILVPFPGKFLEGRLNIPLAKVNDTAKINLELLNLGTDDIQMVGSAFRIFDGDNLIGTIIGKPISIESKERKTININWNTNGISAGEYTVKAFVNYDGGGELTLTDTIKVGDILIKILNYTQEFIKNGITPMYVQIRSFWNEPIYGIFAKIQIYENQTRQQTLISPTIGNNPWDNRKLTAYLDTSSLSLGEHNITIEVFYENKTATKQGTIYLKEEGFRLPAFINTSTILIFAVFLLIIINIIAFILYARRKKDGTE